MMGIKCPVCMCIRTVQGIEDGEMMNCEYCKTKFTVTRYRRCTVLGEGIDDKSIPTLENDHKLLREFITQMDQQTLLSLMKIAVNELVDRYKENECLK